MASFSSFTDSLKQKWLQFFQVNRDWIVLHMEVESVYTPDGGKRPSSYLILGVVNALEPKLAQLMLPFSKLNPDADILVEVLDLNFDPDAALGNRVLHKVEAETSEDLMEEKKHPESVTNPHTNGLSNGLGGGFGEEAIDHDFVMESEPKSLELGDTGHNDAKQEQKDDVFLFEHQFEHQTTQAQTQLVKDDSDFGDISFDTASAAHTSLEHKMLEEENGFGLMDVWAVETSAQKDEEGNEMLLAEDFSSSAFDDSEIARLFPNH